jgi:hypothetical protein
MSFPTTGEYHPSENRASAQMSPDTIIADTREDHQLYAPRESWAANFSRRIHRRHCWECIARVQCGAVSELAVLEPVNTTMKDLRRVGRPDVTSWTELAVLDTTTKDLRRVGCPDGTKWTEAVLDTTMKGLRRVGCPDVKNWTELADAY